MELVNPAIVISTYNRTQSLARLLESLSKADYPETEIALHISIDHSSNDEVRRLAENYQWDYGTKTVVFHPEHLGLKKHILSCGDLTEIYGAIILLEDDLYVAKSFYLYASACEAYYRADERIAGVSLYSYAIAESCHLPFEPIQEDGDTYFMQVVSSWGQLWNATQWSNFKKWLSESVDVQLPKYIQQWSTESWKRIFFGYLMDTERYFVFPYLSYTTNFHDSGQHSSGSQLFQVKLASGKPATNFKVLSAESIRYDAWFEPEASTIQLRNPSLNDIDFDVDLYASKQRDELNKNWTITARNGGAAERSFSGELKPAVANILENFAGKKFRLVRTEDINFDQENYLEGIGLNIVIPVTSLDGLKDTLDSLPQSPFLHCILVHPPTLTEVLGSMEHAVNVSLHVSNTDDLSAMILEGLNHGKQEIVTYCLPGTRYMDQLLNHLSAIFDEFPKIYCVSGVDETVHKGNAGSLKLGHYRLTWRLYQKGDRHLRFSSELVFWRRSLMGKVLEKATTVEHLIPLSLGMERMHVAGQQLTIRSSQTYESPAVRTIDFEPQSWLVPQLNFLQGMMSRLTRPSFLKNSSSLRFVHGELEVIPFVLRYDAVHHGYYMSNF